VPTLIWLFLEDRAHRQDIIPKALREGDTAHTAHNRDCLGCCHAANNTARTTLSFAQESRRALDSQLSLRHDGGDPLTYTLAGVVVGVASTLAIVLPALRAAMNRRVLP